MNSDLLRNAVYEQLHTLRFGSLCFWGNWFGKPSDNLHRIVGAASFGGPAVIYFDQGETLTIDEPRDWLLEGGRLVIGQAERLRFQWFEYGELPGRESLRCDDYRWMGGRPVFETNFMGVDRQPVLDPRAPAVELQTA